MGLFDKLKNAVENAVGGFEEAYEAASAMELEALCDAMKEMGKLDPKILAYRQALSDKCAMMSDNQLEEFYQFIKKAGSFLKEHPGKDAVEKVLVDRRMYLRNEDGTIQKNHAYKLFRK